jgi:hypothetical protein
MSVSSPAQDCIVCKGAGRAVQKVRFKDLIKSKLKILGIRGMFLIVE